MHITWFATENYFLAVFLTYVVHFAIALNRFILEHPGAPVTNNPSMDNWLNSL